MHLSLRGMACLSCLAVPSRGEAMTRGPRVFAHFVRALAHFELAAGSLWWWTIIRSLARHHRTEAACEQVRCPGTTGTIPMAMMDTQMEPWLQQKE